jgi:hypothetical protein
MVERVRRIDSGLVLFALGIAGILWGVVFLLDNAYGESGIGTTFATRPRYDEVKVNIHASFAGAYLRALAGLALAILGWRRMRRAGGKPAGEA